VKGTRGRKGAFAGAWRLGLAGFFAIAVALGPARSGFGLFLPDIRREFGLSTEVSGVIAGGSYGGYLVALSLVGLFATRFDPRLFATVGGISVWSSLLFSEQPSTGYSAVLLFLGIGTIVGPVVRGTFAGHSSFDAAFLVAGAVALLAALVAVLARTSEDPSVSPAPRAAQER
jgi:sugar phosphate permease